VEIGRALVGQVHESVVTMGRAAGSMTLGRYTFERPLITVMSFGTEHTDAANMGADLLNGRCDRAV
jgi:hypothetical protein